MLVLSRKSGGIVIDGRIRSEDRSRGGRGGEDRHRGADGGAVLSPQVIGRFRRATSQAVTRPNASLPKLPLNRLEPPVPSTIRPATSAPNWLNTHGHQYKHHGPRSPRTTCNPAGRRCSDHSPALSSGRVISPSDDSRRARCRSRASMRDRAISSARDNIPSYRRLVSTQTAGRSPQEDRQGVGIA